MSTRFRSRDATPPTGCYEYSVGGETVTSRSRMGISGMALALRAKHGLESVGDGFSYVEEYMCPFLPNGYCTEPSTVNPVRIEEVKVRTAAVFGMTCATSDVISERLAICAACPGHVTKGFCMGSCSGLLEWIYKGFGGRRGRLPADFGMGVCPHDLMFVVALATLDFSNYPPRRGEAYPSGCWRTQETTK